MSIEGRKIAYAGDDVTIGQGSLGRVLAISGESCHVQWLDGSKQGMVDLIDMLDCSVTEDAVTTAQVIAAEFDASLDIPSESTFVVEAMDNYGVDGVVAALEEAGQLAVLAPYASEALGSLSASLRADVGLADALSGLDEGERESVLARVAQSLLEDEEGLG